MSTTFRLEPIMAQPQFDLELFMTTSQEHRIGGDVMDKLTAAWDTWLPHAKASKIITEEASYLVAWLGEEVEEFVDDMWEDSPSEAFLYNALAQVMCMGMVHDVLPEVEDVGCAAAPACTDALMDALEAVGTPYLVAGEPGLQRRFAVVTFYPFKGGCEVCALQASCPQGQSKTQGCSSEGPSTVTLPGYDRID